MLNSLTRYISLFLRFKLEKAQIIKSMKLAWFGCLQNTSIAIGLDFGKRNVVKFTKISLVTETRGLYKNNKNC